MDGLKIEYEERGPHTAHMSGTRINTQSFLRLVPDFFPNFHILQHCMEIYHMGEAIQSERAQLVQTIVNLI